MLKTVGIVWECCESFALLPKGTLFTYIKRFEGNTVHWMKTGFEYAFNFTQIAKN